MGRPPSNGAPSFRFNSAEVAQMEAILQKHEGHVPPRDFLMALANKFSNSPERAGKMVVQMKQVWNWFQNRRYALRAKLVKSPDKPSLSPLTSDNVTPLRSAPLVPQPTPVTSGSRVVRNASESPQMEFEARSARDGAWYDVQAFLSLRYLESSNPEVLVRFVGFGPEEDEWINVLKFVRQRSLPCEASECIVVVPGDLILCFQEGKEQALYFNARVLDVQRRRHDVRGCRCRFLVHYDHDQSEEIVPLRKICRRPETDYRLHQLHAEAASGSVSAEPPKPVVDLSTASMPNPGPSSAAIANHPPPSMGAGPSALAPAATLAPTPPPIMALSPAVVQTSVPTLISATDPSTATVPVSALVSSDPAPVTAPIASAPVTQPVASAPVTECVAASAVTEPVTLAVVTESGAPVEAGKPIALAPVVAPVSPASVAAAVAPTPVVSSVNIEIERDNSAPVPEPMELDKVDAGMAADKVAPQENVTNPAAASIVPDAKLIEGSAPQTGPLTGTGDLNGNPTVKFPEPDNIGGDPSAYGALGVEGSRTTTAPTADVTNNVLVKTEEVKE